MKKIITLVFFILLILDCYLIGTANYDTRILVKPFLMPLLALWYVLSCKKPSFYFVLALFFSFLGDVFLLDAKNYFVLGLASFLLTHVLYVSIIYKNLKDKSISKMPKFLVPFAFFFSIIVFLIYPNLGEMLIPVLVYGAIIALFGMMSLTNYVQNKSSLNLLLLFGAILFIVSDSFIALDKFYTRSVILQILVMTFYGISQYLITKVMISKTNTNA